MTQILITVDHGLPPCSGLISKTTWMGIMAGTSHADADEMLVGDDIFNPKYKLIISKNIEENILILSCDVKSEIYSNIQYLNV